MKEALRISRVCGAFAALLCAGCSVPGTGQKLAVPPTAAQEQAVKQRNIDNVENNPKIPANQKQAIINTMNNGPASTGQPVPKAPTGAN